MNINSIFYDLHKHNEEIISKCELFTSEDIGFIPIKFLARNKYKLQDSEHILSKEMFADMMVFDALIGNIDRHMGNYGMLIDNNSNKILSPAPLFDNGLGILGWYDEGLSDMQTQMSTALSAFDFTFDNQLNRYLSTRHYDSLEKLRDFTFTRHDKYNIEEQILCEFEHLLHKRVSEILDRNISISYSPSF